ncbi:SPOSA6832_00748, partial [Sporobolomyces salmonicolor]
MPTQTIRPPKSLGIVGLDVDKSPEGASFLVSSSIDSVISRYSVDGKQEGRKELGPGGEGRVRVLSAAMENFGEELATMEATGSFGSAIEYSNGGNLIAVATDTGYVTLFDAETGALVSTFPGPSGFFVIRGKNGLLTLTHLPAHSAPIRSLSFTSNLLVTGSDDKRINVFDLRALTSSTGAGGSRRGQVASLGGHEGWVVSVAARNERLLASGCVGGVSRLWSTTCSNAESPSK